MAHRRLEVKVGAVVLMASTGLTLGLTLGGGGPVSASQSASPTTIDVFGINPPSPALQSQGLTPARFAGGAPTTVAPTAPAASASPSVVGSAVTTTLPPVVITSSATPPATGITHQVAPVASSLPASSCTNQSLTAKLSSAGPAEAMGVAEWIITVSSSTPCTVDGYPTLTFSGTTTSTAVLDGGIGGNPGPASQSRVALGIGLPASFLVELSDVTSPACSPATSLLFGVPGEPASVAVTPDPSIGSWWSCPGTRVTPFEQGNSVSNYA